MLMSLEEISDARELDADVIVVGSGAVGTALAIELSRRGRRVTLLEAGGLTVSSSSQRYLENARSISRKLPGLHQGRFRALGGTTNFWGGQLVELESIVFAERSWMGDSVRWPFAKETLEPYYARALALLGMGDSPPGDESIRQRLGLGRLQIDGDLELFFTRWLPEPNFKRLFERDFRDRANLRVVVNAPVVALRPASSGADRLRGVLAVDARGRRVDVEGGAVVLANGTIEIARLLLLPFPGGEPTPWGRNPWLGRGFMDHLDLVAGEVRASDARALHDVFDNAIIGGIKYQPKLKLSEAAQRREGLAGIACHLIYNSSLSDDLAAAKIFLKGFLRGRLKASLPDLPRQLLSLVAVGGPMLVRYLRHRRIYSPTDRGIQIRLTAEQRPLASSGIRLGSEHDELRMPIAEIDWRVDGGELETFGRFAEHVSRFFESNRLGEVSLDPRLAARDPELLDEAIDGLHHMGMARMGADRGSGVVDADLKLFGTRNAYVAGAAVYPSSGFANPTFTAIALGLRLAERLAGVGPC